MGDRANIYIIDSAKADRGIYLYTHWNGYEWPEELRKALEKARPRWGDVSYCTRILVSNLYSDIHDQEIGGGISTFITDNSYPVIVVDQVAQTVAFATVDSETDRSAWTGQKSFAEYVASKADYPG